MISHRVTEKTSKLRCHIGNFLLNEWGTYVLIVSSVNVLQKIITSAKEDMFSSLFVSLSVCSQLCAKTSARICAKFSAKVGNGPMNNRLNFGGDPDHRLNTGIVSRLVTIGRYTESGINRLHWAKWWACTSRHRHSNYDVIMLPALGGGMQCPSAYS